MKRNGYIASLVALVVLVGSFYAPSPALSEPYFKGKKITIVIASGPGGRKDRITRTVVRYLSKYIPGKPQFIVRNIPEPAGITAAHEFLRGRRDGTISWAVGSREIEAPAFGLPKANYDFRTFVWIGGLSTGKQRNTLVTHIQAGFKNLEDLKSREVILGAPRVGHRNYYYGRLAAEVLDLKVRWVIGYSVTELWLAMQRGEVDGRFQDAGSIMVEVPHLVKKKLMIPHVTMTLPERLPPSPDPFFANVPSLMDFAKTDLHRSIIQKINATDEIGVSMAFPPGTPTKLATIVEKAFLRADQDPQFRKDVERFVGIRPYAGVLNAATVSKAIRVYSTWQPEVLATYKRLATQPPK